MFVPAAASSAPDSAGPAVDLVVAFAEPARVAAGWAEQPPTALLVLFGITLVLFALSHRVPAEDPHLN